MTGEQRKRTFKEVVGSAAATLLAVVIALIATVMFLLKIGVEFAFLGSIWSFLTGEWRIGLTLLGIALVASWLFLGG